VCSMFMARVASYASMTQEMLISEAPDGLVSLLDLMLVFLALRDEI
jgi:hypothetical protein